MVKIVFSEAATGGVLYKKVFLKFKKLTAKHKDRISFLINLQDATGVFTYHLNLKIF